MRCIGGNDRIFRILLGIAVMATGAYLHSWWALLGLVPLTVGIIGHCPSFGVTEKVHLNKESLSARVAPEDSAGYRVE